MQAYLILANGRILKGKSLGCQGTTVGEVVFATGMVGFEETLTDPSYYGQIITQTYTQRKERASGKSTARQHVHVSEDTVIGKHRIQCGIGYKRNRNAASKAEYQNEKERKENLFSQILNLPDGFQFIHCYFLQVIVI